VAISGSYDFTLTANEIIAQAFGKLGKVSEGKSLSAKQYQDGRIALNLLVKTWQAKPHLWMKTAASVTLVASQAEYALATLFGSKPMRVLSIRRRITTGSLDTPLQELSRQEYEDIPNKTVASIPVSFYYDPQRALGTLSIWPTASTATAAAQTLQVTYLRRLADFDTSSDDPDFPQEWLGALVYGTAVWLMPEYPVNDSNLSGLVISTAQALYADLSGWDEEPASIYMQMDTRG
jgi:hypothetical protein